MLDSSSIVKVLLELHCHIVSKGIDKFYKNKKNLYKFFDRNVPWKKRWPDLIVQFFVLAHRAGLHDILAGSVSVLQIIVTVPVWADELE